MKGQIAVDALFGVLVLLSVLGIFTAFVDRGSVEVRRGLHYVICDVAGGDAAKSEALLRLSGMGHPDGDTETVTLMGGTNPATLRIDYHDRNVAVTVTYSGTTIECLGRAVPKWP